MTTIYKLNINLQELQTLILNYGKGTQKDLYMTYWEKTRKTVLTLLALHTNYSYPVQQGSVSQNTPRP